MFTTLRYFVGTIYWLLRACTRALERELDVINVSFTTRCAITKGKQELVSLCNCRVTVVSCAHTSKWVARRLKLFLFFMFLVLVLVQVLFLSSNCCRCAYTMSLLLCSKTVVRTVLTLTSKRNSFLLTFRSGDRVAEQSVFRKAFKHMRRKYVFDDWRIEVTICVSQSVNDHQ